MQNLIYPHRLRTLATLIQIALHNYMSLPTVAIIPADVWLVMSPVVTANRRIEYVRPGTKLPIVMSRLIECAIVMVSLSWDVSVSLYTIRHFTM